VRERLFDRRNSRERRKSIERSLISVGSGRIFAEKCIRRTWYYHTECEHVRLRLLQLSQRQQSDEFSDDIREKMPSGNT
jgi:hypothetical protein